ncbi:MAG: hypothetical protein RX318_07580 [bacterium]|nr:hypothetical protein [bacterium]
MQRQRISPEGAILVCIVGANHRIQWVPQSIGPEWREKLEEFIAYIQCQCEENCLELVAEEFSEYALRENQADNSTAQLAANRMNLQHLFCDPDHNERRILGIQNEEDQEKENEGREKEWLRRLLCSGKQRILFICGDSHVDSFEARLVKLGHQAKILRGNWGQDWALTN